MRSLAFGPPLLCALAFTLLPMSACNKDDGASTAPDTARTAAADPVEAAVDKLIATLQGEDYDAMVAMATGPLAEDMSREAFKDMHAIVDWLGYVKSKRTTQDDMPVQEGGVRRTYIIEFEKEEVVLEATVLDDGKVLGFHFSGDGFYRAEHGVIADQFREFKVYDFHWTQADGTKFLPGTAIKGNHVSYHLVVGGIEAFGGKHHVRVKKTLKDASGKEIYVEPIEFDVKFDENAEGIPRGEITGEFDVPGPGNYELILNLRDDVAVVDVDHGVKFEVVAP